MDAHEEFLKLCTNLKDNKQNFIMTDQNNDRNKLHKDAFDQKSS